MFWIKTIIAFIIISLVLLFGSVLERHLANMPSPRPGLILPVLATLVAIALAVPNFIQSFSYPFSPLAFSASVALFVFYMIPAGTFMLLYTEARRNLVERAKRRTAAGRDTRRQVTRERMEPRMPDHYAGKMRSSDNRTTRRPTDGRAPRSSDRPADRTTSRPAPRSKEGSTRRPSNRDRR